MRRAAGMLSSFGEEGRRKRVIIVESSDWGVFGGEWVVVVVRGVVVELAQGIEKGERKEVTRAGRVMASGLQAVLEVHRAVVEMRLEIRARVS